eukprot:TRINITY_DN534_c0_g1_i2.p1 TRINITY_DN534_c0_g1~~TRINITY_DN534_c0_g1_i2.p1  ORF type:complete len:192 (-),score=8.05 TRINITY_DN534_c0_g1_i2:94-669(-)
MGVAFSSEARARWLKQKAERKKQSRLHARVENLIRECGDESLAELKLDHTALHTVPPKVFQCDHIMHLDLSHNSVCIFHVWHTLNMRARKRERERERERGESLIERVLLPPSIHSLTPMHTHFHNLQLGDLPAAIANDLLSLKAVSLSNNKFSEIPECLTKLPNLTSLDMSCNSIAEITPEIANLSNTYVF